MLATAKVNQSKFKHQEQRTLPNARLEFIKKKILQQIQINLAKNLKKN